MASTYNDVKIQLMATGENNTTWGDVTNVNWGAVTELVTGSADVAFSSADVTISLTNTNATQTARNLRLNLTGTSGGARNLVVPTIEKLYLVNNGLADAVTVKTTAGTGIAVPAGKTMWVFADGTNVVDAVNTLTSLTLASALATSSGGTGLTSYNANGAVYATSSSALTTGTLPVNAGGTGATSLTANNVIVGNGTSTVTFVAPGTSGNVLSSNGTAWVSTAAALPVGAVPVSSGGTGATSLTANNVIVGNGTSTVTFVAPGTSGNVLSSNGTAWVSTAAGTPPATIETISGADTLAGADLGKILVLDGTFTLGFDACASLGSGWYVDVRFESGVVTFNPDGAETIDGKTTILGYADEPGYRIYCDGSSLSTIGRTQEGIMVSSQSCSGVATVDFESIFTDPELVTMDFQFIEVLGPASASNALNARLKYAGSYVTTSNAYLYIQGGTNVNNGGLMRMNADVNPGRATGWIRMVNPLASTASGPWLLSDAANASTYNITRGSLNTAQSGTTEGVRFYFSGSNMQSGTIKCYLNRV
jgi:hypothetical protein